MTALVLWAIACTSAWPQSQGKEHEQIKRLRLQMRQMQQDQMDLQSNISRLTQENQKLTDEKNRLNLALTSASNTLLVQQNKTKNVEQKSIQSENRNKNLVIQNEQLKNQITSLAQEQEKTQSQLLKEQQNIVEWQSKQQACFLHNQALVGIGHELLKRYQKKGLAEVMAVHEPFVQKASVDLENFSQAYAEKINVERVKP